MIVLVIWAFTFPQAMTSTSSCVVYFFGFFIRAFHSAGTYSSLMSVCLKTFGEKDMALAFAMVYTAVVSLNLTGSMYVGFDVKYCLPIRKDVCIYYTPSTVGA